MIIPGMESRPIHVLLADDHPVVRGGYRRLIEGHGDMCVVAEAGDGDAAYLAYQKHCPDVVVLDLSMPGGGLATLQRIRARDPEARVLVFSMHVSGTIMRRAREAGALGYLTKSSPAEQLVEAIRRVACGLTYDDPSMAADAADGDSGGSGSGDPTRALTPREFQIFKLLAEGQSLGEIAAALFISPKTANVHHGNIMRKLDIGNDAQLVRLAFHHQIIR